MGTHVTYGEGGYDPTKPNDNVVSIDEVEDEYEVAPDGGTVVLVGPDAVVVDPATVDSVRAALAKATTVTAVKNALGPLLDALG